MNLFKSLLLAFVLCTVAFESYGSELRLLTWNVFMLPTPIKYSKQKMRRENILKELSARQEQYDVMVFQEAFIERFRKQLKESLKSTHPYAYSMGKGGKIRVFGPGLLIVSKYPIEIQDKVYYKKCSGADCFAAKGAFLAEVALPENKHVQIIVTHMQAGQKPKKIQIRTTQVEQLRAFMEKNKRPNVPQILAGDLNINSLVDVEFPVARQHLGMNAPFDTIVPARRSGFHSSRATKTECFGKTPRAAKARHDHIWIGNESTQTEIKSLAVTPIQTIVDGEVCDLSDHLPLAMHLTL